jgi:hypothetical protein
MCRQCAIKQERCPCPLCRGETKLWIRRTKEEKEQSKRRMEFNVMSIRVRAGIEYKYNNEHAIWRYTRLIKFENRFFSRNDLSRMNKQVLVELLIDKANFYNYETVDIDNEHLEWFDFYTSLKKTIIKRMITLEEFIHEIA